MGAAIVANHVAMLVGGGSRSNNAKRLVGWQGVSCSADGLDARWMDGRPTVVATHPGGGAHCSQTLCSGLV